MFVPAKKFNFSTKRINKLKLKAAEFLTKKFEVLHNHPGMAVLLPRTKGQSKSSKVVTLGNTANNAVVNFDNEYDGNDNKANDDDSETSDDDDETGKEEDDFTEPQSAFGNLISPIGTWNHAKVPRN
ncbi:Hypothetical predicted protein [Paramuricea clavata]|uniref:Uncharacterized protein n=1 Tax=Paramuricea clavata TaxID=317549 RepID=A0A7D9DLP9_PARCT|nr:Hypothetical predicted protein [Paramuricea clavata]